MQPFVVKISALASGVSHYDWIADASFFGKFENTEILDADLKVSLTLHNHGVTLDAECDIEGTVTVACDRCRGPCPSGRDLFRGILRPGGR